MAHILVADDEEALRVFLARALTLRGHQVETAMDGAEALQKLGNGRFDLLLSDIMMPVMDGITLALNASRDHPKLPIIMMTGYVAEKSVLKTWTIWCIPLSPNRFPWMTFAAKWKKPSA